MSCLRNHVLRIGSSFVSHPVIKKTQMSYLLTSCSDDRKLTAGVIAICFVSGQLLLTPYTSLKFTSRNRSATIKNRIILKPSKPLPFSRPPPPEQTVAPRRSTELGALPGTDRPMAQKSTNQKPRYVMWNKSGRGNFEAVEGMTGRGERGILCNDLRRGR